MFRSFTYAYLSGLLIIVMALLMKQNFEYLIPTGNTKSRGRRTSIEKTNYLKKPFVGRIGNQMFEWASTLGISHEKGLKPCVDHILVPQLSLFFRGPFPLCNREELPTPEIVWNENGHATHNNFGVPPPNTNVKLIGYLQSFKYFNDPAVTEMVMNSFDFKTTLEIERIQFLEKFQRTVKIGVHVRRGDVANMMESHSKLKKFMSIPSNSFYQNAMDYMRLKFGRNNVIFVVVSDDIDWCSAQGVFQDSDIVFTGKSPEVDLAILAGCDHMIFGFGTFGWWASWLVSINHRDRESRPLGGGQVIYYGNHFNKENNPGVRLEDFYPPEWIPM